MPLRVPTSVDGDHEVDRRRTARGPSGNPRSTTRGRVLAPRDRASPSATWRRKAARCDRAAWEMATGDVGLAGVPARSSRGIVEPARQPMQRGSRSRATAPGATTEHPAVRPMVVHATPRTTAPGRAESAERRGVPDVRERTEGVDVDQGDPDRTVRRASRMISNANAPRQRRVEKPSQRSGRCLSSGAPKDQPEIAPAKDDQEQRQDVARGCHQPVYDASSTSRDGRRARWSDYGDQAGRRPRSAGVAERRQGRGASSGMTIEKRFPPPSAPAGDVQSASRAREVDGDHLPSATGSR